MTNEELVIEIKNGKTEYLPVLWEQVERFVAYKAIKVVNALKSLNKNDNRIEFDDLYDSAYLYLQEAVDYHVPEKGYKFLTTYDFFLKRAFAEVTGIRTSKTRNDPLKKALSLDSPVREGEETTYGDMIADDVDVAEQVTENVAKQELHNALEKALSTLPPIQEKVIRQRYYENLTLEETGKRIGHTAERARQIEYRGLSHLRNPEIIKELEKFVDMRTNFYIGTSVESQLSPVELIVLRREELRAVFVDRKQNLLKRIEQQQ